MKITTSKGKTFEAGFILASVRDKNRLMIDHKDERALSEIAADWEGAEEIVQADEANPGIEKVFRGYTVLAAISRNRSDNSVRVTLERP